METSPNGGPNIKLHQANGSREVKELKDLNEYAIPIAKREPRNQEQRIRGYIFVVALLTAMIMLHSFQFMCLPLLVHPKTRGLYKRGIRYTKASFGVFMVFICQAFAPTTFRITYDASNSEGIDWVQQDETTGFITLNWPKKVVMIANHQVYADWVYLWILSYFANMHAYVLIVLKKSLKWVPIGGWGMQFFDFIFLARSWAADRDMLISKLSALAAHHTTTTSEHAEDDEPLNFMIFPEGTLVSKDTYPISKKYAEKNNLVHPTHTLLPRSTGLHTCLLALSQLPSLYLMDITVAYPGIPRSGFGQSYYTLRSIFMDAIPPPEVVYHVRLFNVQKDIPLRAKAGGVTEVTSLNERREAAQAAMKNPSLLEATEDDKKVFDAWLRERWMEKDAWIEEWKQRGEVGPLVLPDKNRDKNIQEIKIPLQLRNTIEVMDAFAWFIPLILSWIVYRSL